MLTDTVKFQLAVPYHCVTFLSFSCILLTQLLLLVSLVCMFPFYLHDNTPDAQGNNFPPPDDLENIWNRYYFLNPFSFGTNFDASLYKLLNLHVNRDTRNSKVIDKP
mmetsp:Transcript_21603/g.31317  ORF Transcript_21603/g.31317 Transcript_21603/m.31317 type:complete len:107 (+) Transcript_21603:80-400(+)